MDFAIRFINRTAVAHLEDHESLGYFECFPNSSVGVRKRSTSNFHFFKYQPEANNISEKNYAADTRGGDVTSHISN